MTVGRRQSHRLAGEAGMTLVELMVAALIAAIGVGAVTTVLTGSRNLTTSSERGDAAAHVAEREMERALALPYTALATQQAPTTSSDSYDPRFYVSGSGTSQTYRWDQRTGGEPANRVLVDPANGGLQAVNAWDDDANRLRGTVYRFVTVYDDPSVTNDPNDPVLAGQGDGKRVTIAVTVDGGQPRRRPIVLNSVRVP